MLIKSKEQFPDALAWIQAQGRLAYDIETAPSDLSQPDQAVNPRKGQIIGISLSSDTSSIYLCHKHLENGTFTTYLSKTHMSILLKEIAKHKLIGFNSSFDARFTWHYFGININESIWSEAQLARHTASEESDPWKGLKAEGVMLFGAEASDEQDKLTAEIIANGGTKGHVWLGSLETVADYAMQDTRLTLKVNDYYVDKLTKQGLAKFYYDDEVMPCFRHVTIPLETVGAPVDMNLVLRTQVEMQADLDRLDAEIRAAIAPYRKSFDTWFLNKEYPEKKTGPFVQELAMMWADTLPKTPGGKFSLTAENLSSLLDDNFFRLFMEGKKRLTSEEVREVQERLNCNVDNFNIKSKPHWGKIFFDELNETPLSLTEKTKKPQIDDDFLRSILSKHNFVQLLLDYNRITKLKGTYVDRYAEEVEDGRFYGRFSQHITTTGRMSSDLQQLPKKIDPEDPEASDDSDLVKGYVNRIRDFFTAPEGRVLVGADYSALEVVIFADDAGDETLLNMVRNKYDPYSQGAIDVWGLTEYSADKKAPNFLKSHKPQIRQDTKSWFLGLRYGMGAYKLSKDLGISEAAAKDIIKRYFAAYPKLKTRMDEILTSAQKSGVVRSKGGRIRHLDLLTKLHHEHAHDFQNSLLLWEKYSENETKYSEMKYLKRQYWGMINTALNFPIQSMAATVVTKASIALSKELKRKGLDANLIMTIHDELCVEASKDCANEVAEIMKKVMENTTKLSVPLTAVPVIGQRYGDLK